MNAQERVYRSLLVLYPVEHRRRFGEEMAQLFRDRLRDEGGGLRSILIWSDIGLDVCKTAIIERTELTMDNLKQNWWVALAPAVAGVSMVLGFGNMLEDDGGEFWMRALAFGVTVALSLVVFAGLFLRSRQLPAGSLLIGLAIAPGTLFVIFFWFPPVFALGILCLVISVRALGEYERRRRARQAAASV